MGAIGDTIVAEASRATLLVKRVEEDGKRIEDAPSQRRKELWADVENYKQSLEFEGALSLVVEHFKKSLEFLDGLGANTAYGVCSSSRGTRRSILTSAPIARSFMRVMSLLGLKALFG
ncbi:hypothetical protein LIER_36084 [Lithospermum erythrorhizon]|uniref:Uncharacterized protein n=1 Tax=Lithospermum erythrorhizon TaxID=34254 RepID=A0AAV3P396_LITER